MEQQIAQALPDAQVPRFAGAGRTETARLVNTLTAELGRKPASRGRRHRHR